MSEKKRLGKGVAGLFSEPSEGVSKETEATTEVREETVKGAVDDVVLKQAVDKVRSGKPVTSVWSRPIKVALHYLFLTVPGFRESVTAEKMLEEALKTKYPELWEKVQQADLK